MSEMCPVDGRPVVRSARGRPAIYCSPRCKRMVARYRDALPHMRSQLEWWRSMAARYPRDEVYRFEDNAAKVAASIAELERKTSTEGEA